MKLKKHLLVLCILIVLIAALGVTFAGAAEAKAAPGAANKLVLEDLTILYPAKATDVEMSAVKELQNYLYKATGTKPTAAKEYKNCPSAIYVGATDFAAKNKVTYTDNNGQGEGWVIKVVGSNVVITGGETRGALYGVYHLLEDVVGVRWWNLWEEHVPSLTDAVIPADYHDSGEPIFVYRDIYFAENAQGISCTEGSYQMTGRTGLALADRSHFRPIHIASG